MPTANTIMIRASMATIKVGVSHQTKCHFDHAKGKYSGWARIAQPSGVQASANQENNNGTDEYA